MKLFPLGNRGLGLGGLPGPFLLLGEVKLLFGFGVDSLLGDMGLKGRGHFLNRNGAPEEAPKSERKPLAKGLSRACRPKDNFPGGKTRDEGKGRELKEEDEEEEPRPPQGQEEIVAEPP